MERCRDELKRCTAKLRECEEEKNIIINKCEKEKETDKLRKKMLEERREEKECSPCPGCDTIEQKLIEFKKEFLISVSR